MDCRHGICRKVYIPTEDQVKDGCRDASQPDKPRDKLDASQDWPNQNDSSDYGGHWRQESKQRPLRCE
jgi:hypothetical protein